ncbi:hypothetical protein SAMN05444352_102219 [Pseudomonas japonica]|uniref:Uncharacterized protein n=1 Tax=Pseudomonas japonica TaxID=256466 RepID=A0A239B0R8_9PSED|nr:hypothetical protein SAMN05444352_102219 [Pseudomonas japonica]
MSKNREHMVASFMFFVIYLMNSYEYDRFG